MEEEQVTAANIDHAAIAMMNSLAQADGAFEQSDDTTVEIDDNWDSSHLCSVRNFRKDAAYKGFVDDVFIISIRMRCWKRTNMARRSSNPR